MIRLLLISLMATSLLSGCGTSAPVRYYSLPGLAPSGTGSGNGTAAATLAIGPLQLAEYLDHPQIVTLGPGAIAELDEFARWVEPLSDGVPRVLATNLAELLPEWVVVAYPFGAGLRPDYRLSGRVNRLDCTADGQAVLEIQWAITRTDGAAALLGPAATRHVGRCDSGGERAAVAMALGAVLADFSRELAGRIRRAHALTRD